MKAVATEAEVYLWLGATDMRAGFERLASLVQERMNRTVIAGGMYVFVSRCRRRVKILHWDRDGYALWYKRLEAGTFRVEQREGVEIVSGVDLEQLLSGIELSRIILRRNAEKGLYNAA